MTERLAALLRLPPYQRHRQLLATHAAALPRTDADVLREHHRFIREDEGEAPASYEERLAAKYYSKLFKEYAIADLRHYKEQRIGLRWRTAEEVVAGRGQFACAAKGCDAADGLVSYEVNFAYDEAGEHKQALVKLRVCPRCADKLNYKRKTALRRADARARDADRERKRKRASDGDARDAEADAEDGEAGAAAADAAAAAPPPTEAEHWGAAAPKAERSRDDEFDAYFSGMFA
jgi:hypothetical protein